MNPYFSNDIIVIEKTRQKILEIYGLLILQGFANNYDGKSLSTLFLLLDKFIFFVY